MHGKRTVAVAAILAATAALADMSGRPAGRPVADTMSHAGPSANAAARFTPLPGTRFSIEGTTNVGSWQCRGDQVDVRAEVSATATEIEAAVEAIEQRVKKGPIAVTGAATAIPRIELQLTIPVRTLGCGNARMERDMYSALRAETHRNISFRFDRVIDAAVVAPHMFLVTVEGQLSLAGETRQKRLALAIERRAPMRYDLRGDLGMRMTDFRVSPPVALMGLIRAHDPLTVRFDLPLTIR